MGYADASNMYAYAGNDPINFRDPSGEYVGKGAVDLYTGYNEGFLTGAAGLAEGIGSLAKGAWNAVGAATYKATGWEGSRAQSEAFHQGWAQTREVMKADVFFPALWNKGKEAVATVRSGDMRAIGNLAGQIGFEIVTEAATAGAAGVATSIKLVNGVDNMSDIVRGARSVEHLAEAADTSSDIRRVAHGAEATDNLHDLSRIEGKAADEVASFGPCPRRPMPACVAADTEILVPFGEKPIEELRVGDRVATSWMNRSFADGATTVDSVNWQLVTLRMDNPERAGDEYAIETLRPLDWILEHGAFPGRKIEFETDRNPRDHARVVAVGPVPEIAKGPGRVVLSTFAHVDELLEIRVEGNSEVLEVTPAHRLYALGKSDWVAAGKLTAGDRIRTRDGEAVIAEITRTAKVERVFDLEVEGDHAYLASHERALTHNCGDYTAELAVDDVASRRHLKRELRKQLGLKVSDQEAHHIVPWQMRDEELADGVTASDFCEAATSRSLLYHS